MTIKEIEDYINTHRLYPDEYTGKRDILLLRQMNRGYKFNPKNNTITRLEGKINDNGDFELIGSFTFPVGNPEVKVPADTLNIDNAIKTYNQLVIDMGYDGDIIENNPNTENWNLRDMVAEIEYIRSTYYDKTHVNTKLRAEDPNEFNRRTNRLRNFIRTYKPYIDDLKAYTIHNSKYDN